MAQGRVYELFVPGRICLLGEHSDWAGSYRRFNKDIVPGMCLVSGTNQGLFARCKHHPDKLILKTTDHHGVTTGQLELPMEPQNLLQVAAEGGHFSYMAGVTYQIMIRYQVQGLVLDNYKTDLPDRKGLSSSAAACVLIARAFNRLYDLKLTVRGEMDLAYHGEITTPSQCGRMDQCCAFGARPVLMTFDGDRLDCDELALGGTLHIVIVELAGTKDTTEILQKLNKAYPVADDEKQAKLQDLLGPTNKRLVTQTMSALADGDIARVGALMVECQAAFDECAMPMCPSQLTAPNLHKVLGHPTLQPHIWGGKGVGSQGDGCAQLLCKSEEDVEVVMKIVQAELGMSCMPLQIGAVTPVAQALIPAASFSSALFPASKCLPPALFPVMDADGLLKPAILILVEEAIAAGLHRVVIVVSAAQHADFETIFHKQASMREYNRVPERLRQYADSIVEMGRKVHLVVQEEQHGLGHAVLCARAALEPAPFVLMLGDHLYRSSTGTSCVAQLVSAYAGRSLIALRRTAEIDISHLGTACGKWEATRDAPAAYRRLALSALVEKPSTDYARANLVTPGLPNGEYLTAFGLYVIHEYRSLFEVLQEEHQVREQLGPSASLLQLTPALDRIRAEAGLAGILLDGERYDIGHTPADYLATLNALAKKPSGEDSDLA